VDDYYLHDKSEIWVVLTAGTLYFSHAPAELAIIFLIFRLLIESGIASNCFIMDRWKRV